MKTQRRTKRAVFIGVGVIVVLGLIQSWGKVPEMVVWISLLNGIMFFLGHYLDNFHTD